MLNDTHPDVERAQIELLRKAGGPARFARMRSMTATVIALSRRAIARLHPDWDSNEVDLKFVELNYGEALAEGVRRRAQRGVR